MDSALSPAAPCWELPAESALAQWPPFFYAAGVMVLCPCEWDLKERGGDRCTLAAQSMQTRCSEQPCRYEWSHCWDIVFRRAQHRWRDAVEPSPLWLDPETPTVRMMTTVAVTVIRERR